MLKDIFQNVRLDAELRRKLDQTAGATGLDKSTLIRIAVKMLLSEIEKNDGRLVLPSLRETSAPYPSTPKKQKRLS